MDSGACRESLATLLSQEISHLNELAGLLEHEHGLLVANDVDALEEAMLKRQAVVGRLLDIEGERRGMARAHGHTGDVKGLEQLFSWCDPTGTLKTRMAEAARGAVRCRELNDKNGALVLARMKRVEGLLGAITGQPREMSATYGRKGQYATPSSGRVLSTEA